MSQQYVDGEAVWTEKAKIYAEKSNGLKPVYTFSLPSALQEPVGGQEEKSPNVFLMEDRKGVGRLCGTASFSFISEVYHNRPAILIKHSNKTNIK